MESTINIALSVAVAALFVYSTFIEPAGLRIRKEKVSIKGSVLRRPVRILFLSDLHVGICMPRVWIRRKMAVVARTHEENPYDLVILGGDYVDRSITYLPRFKELLTHLVALGIPLYAVLGNHDDDYGTVNASDITDALRAAGVQVLCNEAALWSGEAGTVEIIGLKDLGTSTVYHPTKRPDFNPMVYRERAEQMDWYLPFKDGVPGAVRVLVGHNPDTVYLPGTPRPRIVLSGHTHGGQVFFMDLFSRILYLAMPRGSFQGFAGRREINGSTLLISRGFGGSFIPFRLLRPPEGIAVEIVPDSAQEK